MNDFLLLLQTLTGLTQDSLQGERSLRQPDALPVRLQTPTLWAWSRLVLMRTSRAGRE